MRIEICGFYGFGNVGDEAILQSIMEQLGNHEYIISTSLPYSQQAFQNYSKIIGKEIRLHEDMRTDFDAYILGGGDLNWGYGWRQCLSIFSKNIPCMNYAVGYNKRWYYNEKFHKLYYEFLKNFNVITVRDESSLNLLRELNSTINKDNLELNPILTFDPAILLKEEKFEGCPTNKIVVFPRYEDDNMSNQSQLDWLVNELKDVSSEVILVSCAPKSIEGIDVDMNLCKRMNDKLKGSTIVDISPFEPKKLKYLISQSKMVYSGGRYHPVVFAISHNIPFKFSPFTDLYSKNSLLLDMYKKFGRDMLIFLANRNKEFFFKYCCK